MHVHFFPSFLALVTWLSSQAVTVCWSPLVDKTFINVGVSREYLFLKLSNKEIYIAEYLNNGNLIIFSRFNFLDFFVFDEEMLIMPGI